MAAEMVGVGGNRLGTYPPGCAQPAQLAATFQTVAAEMKISISGPPALARLIGFSKTISSGGCSWDPDKGFRMHNNVGGTHTFVEPEAECPPNATKQGLKRTCIFVYPDLKTGSAAMFASLRDQNKLEPFLKGDLPRATAALVEYYYPAEEPTWGPDLAGLRSEVWPILKNELQFASEEAYFLLTGKRTKTLWNDSAWKPSWYVEYQKQGGPDGEVEGEDESSDSSGSSNALLIGGAVAALAAVVYFGTRKR